jgi:hypothetical protein
MSGGYIRDMREVTIACDECGTRLPLEQGKEVLIEESANKYFLQDLCPKCLDAKLQAAGSVNDTDGYRQQAAALINLKAS